MPPKPTNHNSRPPKVTNHLSCKKSKAAQINQSYTSLHFTLNSLVFSFPQPISQTKNSQGLIIFLLHQPKATTNIYPILAFHFLASSTENNNKSNQNFSCQSSPRNREEQHQSKINLASIFLARSREQTREKRQAINPFLEAQLVLKI